MRTGAVCHTVVVSRGLVDHTRSKFHTLAQSYMRSRESVDQRAERRSTRTDPQTNSDPEIFVRFWPYIKYMTKKKKKKNG